MKRKIKENKPKKEINVNRRKAILKWIAIICGIIIIVELFYLLIVYMMRESKVTYYDGLNMIEEIEGGYIAVGSSDFRHSKGNEWTQGYEKGKLAKYDENYKLLWEVKYENGYNTTFYDVEQTSDGYFVVGSGEITKEQTKDSLRDALLIKYDLEGDVVFEKQFQVLGDSKFLKVKTVDDGIYVIGQSIFPPMDLGFASNGGGILIKYDFEGNEIFRANYGGSKSGLFNDFVISDDGIYIVGKDATDTGILVKYSMTGEFLWVKNYSYTDMLGFSSIVEHNNELIVVGSKKAVDDDNDYDTDGLLVKYDKTGKLLMEKTFTVNERVEEEKTVLMSEISRDRFNSLAIDDDDNIIITGHYSVMDEEESDETKNVFRYNGLFLKYSLDGKLLEKRELNGSRDEFFTGIFEKDSNYLLIGYSNSKDKDFKWTGRNGKDYEPFFMILNEDGEIKKIR